MKYLIDISAYSCYGKGHTRLRGVFNENNSLLIPLIVLGELRTGFAAGTKKATKEELLAKLLNAPNVSTCNLSDKITLHFANIFAELRSKGNIIGRNDIWIAALAREHDLTLVAMDSDFHAVENLKIFQLSEH